jgi:hypothetical protein
MPCCAVITGSEGGVAIDENRVAGDAFAADHQPARLPAGAVVAILLGCQRVLGEKPNAAQAEVQFVGRVGRDTASGSKDMAWLREREPTLRRSACQKAVALRDGGRALPKCPPGRRALCAARRADRVLRLFRMDIGRRLLAQETLARLA